MSRRTRRMAEISWGDSVLGGHGVIEDGGVHCPPASAPQHPGVTDHRPHGIEDAVPAQPCAPVGEHGVVEALVVEGQAGRHLPAATFQRLMRVATTSAGIDGRPRPPGRRTSHPNLAPVIRSRTRPSSALRQCDEVSPTTVERPSYSSPDHSPGRLIRGKGGRGWTGGLGGSTSTVDPGSTAWGRKAETGHSANSRRAAQDQGLWFGGGETPGEAQQLEPAHQVREQLAPVIAPWWALPSPAGLGEEGLHGARAPAAGTGLPRRAAAGFAGLALRQCDEVSAGCARG